VRNDVYCMLDASKEDATPVPYLDSVPPAIECLPWSTNGAVAPQPGATTALD